MAGLKIRLEAGNETNGVSEKTAPGQNKTGKIAAVSLFATVAKQNIEKVLTSSISDYSRFSGDTSMARDLQNGMAVLGDIESVGIAIATGNPAIIGVTVIGIGINKTISAISYASEIAMSDKQSSFMMERAGNSLTSGGRNTYE
ncbi:MAG: hypothetical protein WCW63_00800 [Acholeplasmataceae bacterium]|jgi:hypothetical protein